MGLKLVSRAGSALKGIGKDAAVGTIAGAVVQTVFDPSGKICACIDRVREDTAKIREIMAARRGGPAAIVARGPQPVTVRNPEGGESGDAPMTMRERRAHIRQLDKEKNQQTRKRNAERKAQREAGNLPSSPELPTAPKSTAQIPTDMAGDQTGSALSPEALEKLQQIKDTVAAIQT
ncbi:MAG: hypothetical protein ACE5EM_13320, partial [Sphingomonadales bacterium]